MKGLACKLSPSLNGHKAFEDQQWKIMSHDAKCPGCDSEALGFVQKEPEMPTPWAHTSFFICNEWKYPSPSQSRTHR